MTPLIVENVVKSYKQGDRAVQALAGVSLAVERGHFWPSWAQRIGKSTLLHLVAGLTSPDSGRILINDTDISTMPDRELTLFRRRSIGLVFQSFNLIPTLSARDNVALPLLLDGKNGSTAYTRPTNCSPLLAFRIAATIGPT
jgi:putative ABC transport system ATP-binding protein